MKVRFGIGPLGDSYVERTKQHKLGVTWMLQHWCGFFRHGHPQGICDNGGTFPLDFKSLFWGVFYEFQLSFWGCLRSFCGICLPLLKTLYFTTTPGKSYLDAHAVVALLDSLAIIVVVNPHVHINQIDI